MFTWLFFVTIYLWEITKTSNRNFILKQNSSVRISGIDDHQKFFRPFKDHNHNHTRWGEVIKIKTDKKSLGNIVFKVSRNARGDKWYLENLASWKLLIKSRNLGSLYHDSRTCFTMFHSFFQGSRHLDESWILPWFVTIKRPKQPSSTAIKQNTHSLLSYSKH